MTTSLEHANLLHSLAAIFRRLLNQTTEELRIAVTLCALLMSLLLAVVSFKLRQVLQEGTSGVAAQCRVLGVVIPQPR